MRRALTTGLIGALFALGAVGCGGDPTSPEADVAGTYTLRTVNGFPLPFDTFDEIIGGQRWHITINSSAIELRRNGTCSITESRRIALGASAENEHDEEECTYEVGEIAGYGRVIEIAFASGGYGSVPWDNGTITLDDDEYIYVYRR